MLRFGILASVIPFVVAGGMVRDWITPSAQPCIPVGASVVRMTSAPWRADFHVAFTANPAEATVRVQIVDRAELADFVVADDIDDADAGACAADASSRLVTISNQTDPHGPVIYLSRDDHADYRIFVASKTFTAREAAALIVGAGGGRTGVTAAAL
jgi:hypothetical protein